MKTALTISLAAVALTALVLFVVGGQYSHWQQEHGAASDLLLSPPQRQLQSLTTTGNDWNPRRAFPLGLCEGDCDDDSDCQAGLVCFQRDGRTAVPGCRGRGTRNNDYCIDPASLPGGGGNNGGGNGGSTFTLKMYWEPGYYWQEETIERRWCMRCDSSREACSAGRYIYITNCDRDMTTDWQFVTNPDNTFFIKIATSNLCISSGRRLTVQTCDANDRRQVWTATKGTRDWSGRFQLRPIDDPDFCVTQSHHPRQGELLGLWECRIPEGDDTSYWEMI